MKLILGSSSKYRKALLEDAGYEFNVVTPDVDEMSIRSADHHLLPLLLARAKAESVSRKVSKPALVVGLDTVVVCDRKLYEKPQSPDEVRKWIKKYGEGNPVEVISAMCVLNTETGKRAEEAHVSKIHFDPVPDAVVEDFIQNGDPYSRAGGFSIQLPFFKPYTRILEGTLESIIGMPIHLIDRLLKEAKED